MVLVAPSKVMYFLPFPSFCSAFPITVAAAPFVPFPLVTVQAGTELPHPIFFTDTFSLVLAKGSQSAPCHPQEVWFFKTVSSQDSRIFRLFWEVKKYFGRD